VGPTLGGLFAEYLSWRWIFLVNLPIGMGAVALIWLFLHEDVESESHQIDYAGSAAILLAVGTLVFGMLQGGVAWPWLSAPSIGVFAVAVALIVLAVWTQ